MYLLLFRTKVYNSIILDFYFYLIVALFWDLHIFFHSYLSNFQEKIGII